MTTVRSFVRLSMCVTVLLMLAGSTRASGAVYFDPTELTVAEADTFAVQISIDADVAGVHCFRVHLDFDRDNVELLSATEGALMPTGGSTFFYVKDTSGIFDIFDCIYNPAEGAVGGPGVLVNLLFTTGVTPCSSPLTLTYALLQDTGLDSLPIVVNDGAVVVAGCCDCPGWGDIDRDGQPDANDLNLLIDVLFFGGTDLYEAACPVTRCDLDASGFADALDLNLLIDYLFFGAQPPTDPCLLVP